MAGSGNPLIAFLSPGWLRLVHVASSFGRAEGGGGRAHRRYAGRTARRMTTSRLSPGPTASLPIFSMATAGGGGPPSSAAHVAWPSTVVTTSVAGASQPTDVDHLPGFGSVPPKLVKRIAAKEYVDIWELLPETWQVETEGSCCHTRRPRRSLVTDIHVWTECFATMAAILSATFPSKAPHFFAYLRIITKASRTFDSSAWASYDMAYRRQAANRGSLDWGVVDPALYNEAFAGRAKLIPRCRYCLADTHSSQECLHAPAEAPPGGPVQADSRPPRSLSRQPQEPTARQVSADICRLFNAPGGSRCRFTQCRYAHLCSRCRRPHPAAECGDRRQQPAPTGGQAPATPVSSGSPAVPGV